jgi:adenosine deaminase
MAARSPQSDAEFAYANALPGHWSAICISCEQDYSGSILENLLPGWDRHRQGVEREIEPQAPYYTHVITVDLTPIREKKDLQKHKGPKEGISHLLINGDIIAVKTKHLEEYFEYHVEKTSTQIKILTVKLDTSKNTLGDLIASPKSTKSPLELGEGGPILFLFDPHMEFTALATAFDDLTRGLRPGHAADATAGSDTLLTESQDQPSSECRLDFAASIAFVSLYCDEPTPPLDATEVTSASDLSQAGITSERIRFLIGKLRQNQFYIRMVARYGWGPFCHVSRLSAYLDRIAIDWTRRPPRREAELGQSAGSEAMEGPSQTTPGRPYDSANNRGKERSFLGFTPEALESWWEDVERIWIELEKRLNYGPWAGVAMESGYFDWMTPPDPPPARSSKEDDSRPQGKKADDSAAELEGLAKKRTEYWKKRSEDYKRKYFSDITPQSLIKCLAHVHQYGRLDSTATEEVSDELGVPWFTRTKKSESGARGQQAEAVSPNVRRKWMNQLTKDTLALWEDHCERYFSEENDEYRLDGILKSFDAPVLEIEKRPSPQERMDELLGKAPASSEELNQEAGHSVARRLITMAGRRNSLRANEFIFGMLIDFSQMLSKGCAHWARESRRWESVQAPDSEEKVWTVVPIRILLIGDHITDPIERRRHYGYLQSAFNAAFPLIGDQRTVELHVIEYEDQEREWDTHQWWVDRLRGDDKIAASRIDEYVACAEGEKERPAGFPKGERLELLAYDIILVEAECQTRFVGPSIIQWLDNAIDEYSVSRKESGDQVKGGVKPRPQLLVLSRDASAGQSFLCLWLGAQAFASKSRIFGIPALLTMANVGKWAPIPTGKKLRPNFSVVEGIIPHQRNRLKSERPQDLIHGDEWDRFWVQRMPKADLHYHIGTSISFHAITAMAANTAGYVIGERPASSGGVGKSRRHELAIEEVVRQACKIVILTRLGLRIIDEEEKKKDNAYKMLWASARYLVQPRGDDGKIVDRTPPKFGAIDQVIKWLVRPDRPVRTFEATSILITAIQVFDCYLQARNGDPVYGDTSGGRYEGVDEEQLSASPKNHTFIQGPTTRQRFESVVNGAWNGLAVLSELMAGDKAGLVGALSQSLDYYSDHIRRNWTDVFNIEQVRDTLRQSAPGALQRMSDRAKERSYRAFDAITRQFDELLSEEKKNWLSIATKDFQETRGETVFRDSGGPEKHAEMVAVFNHDPYNAIFNKRTLPRARASLTQLAVLPGTSVKYRPWEGTDVDRTLQRYLVGSDLLGAEHLQFAENLVLAGLDLGRQNAEDNVVYSEVRCATTGYCQSGLNKYDATELLCVSFDLGALLFGGWRRGSHSEAIQEARSRQERRAQPVPGRSASYNQNGLGSDVDDLDVEKTRLGVVYSLTAAYLSNCIEPLTSPQSQAASGDEPARHGGETKTTENGSTQPDKCWRTCCEPWATIAMWANPTQKQRWIRTNVLLGGKRHKADQIEETVGLVQHYLARGIEYGEILDSVTPRRHSMPASWWKRCSVVGFDLSGDESKKIKELRDLLEPLFVACAPITIHAGEAMDAASIWHAVHQLGAQRIGHGLRLRDSKKLLDHCVRRSICMELCPISNSFTNPFDISPPEVAGVDPVAKRDRYPIKDFIDSWLDACINTDNRSLHRDGALSDEYLKAAQLSGGLTRWDLLRIAKAGFKNAFIPKEEVARLLKHVEYEVYKIACERSGENDFEQVQRWPDPVKKNDGVTEPHLPAEARSGTAAGGRGQTSSSRKGSRAETPSRSS